MSVPISEVQRYVPRWVARFAAAADSPLDTHHAKRLQAAVMFADVSGFTALGEQLAERGPEGAEALWRVVNAFFGKTLDLIQAHGGQVLRFAGDAPIVVWTTDDYSDLAEAVKRAATCSLELQRLLGRYDTGEGVTIGFRVAVSAGEVVAATLGGVRERWEPVVGGSPFYEVAEALDIAEIGDVWVTGKALQLLGPTARSEGTSTGSWKLVGLEDTAEPAPGAAAALSDAGLARARSFVHRGVLQRLDAGHGGWLGELRTVSTLFVSIGGLNYQDPDIGDRLQALVQELQRAVYQYEGTVNQFLVDDKGTVLLAAWGLPSCTHEDDTSRAILAAFAIQEALPRLGLTGSIGISTGRVFCGVKGNSLRSEYGLLGSRVNLAARLMGKAMGGVLCDDATERGARRVMDFQSLPDLSVKGRDGMVAVFQPRPSRGSGPRAQQGMIGREAERAALVAGLERLAAGDGGFVLIEGEAGLGKSVLLNDLRERAAEAGATLLMGAADAIEHQTPYYAFRTIFAAIAGLDAAKDAEGRVYTALQWFQAHPEVNQVAPLFNPVLRLAMPDNELTSVIEGEARAERARAAYLDVLRSQGPLVLVIDDLHWIDSASWELARVAMRDLESVLFVFATRPPSEIAPEHYQQLLAAPGVVHLPLEPLSEPDMVALVCRRLGVRSLPGAVADVIQERAEGHPFYSEELALAMLDEGVITIEDESCTLTPGRDLASLTLPVTLEGIIASRLDRLSPTQLLCTKTASVIGRVFPFQMLEGIYPLAESESDLRSALEVIEERDLTNLELPDPDLAYIFKHVITQEVAYEQLLFQQRRDLHKAAARWYEEGKAGDPAPFLPLIAYHWQRAEVRDKAVDALEAAGEQAFRTFANREAIAFISTAEALDAAGPQPSPEERRGRWARILGEASSRLGRMTEGMQHLERAVALMGHPLPGNVVSLSLKLSGAILRQIWRRYIGPPKAKEAGKQATLDAANTLAELALLAYYHANVPLTMYGMFTAMNLAENCGPSPEVARLKASLGVLSAGIPLHSAAENYTNEAIATAEMFEHGQSTARAHQYRGAYLIAMGRWGDIQPHADTAMEASKAIAYGRGVEEALNLEIYVAMAPGQYPEVFEKAAEQGRSARWREDDQVVFWSQIHQAEAMWRTGQPADALEVLRSMDPSAQSDATIVTRYWGLMVHALVELERFDEAGEAAQHLLPQERTTSFIEIRGYTGLPALYLGLWEKNGPEDGVRAAAKSALGQLQTFAGISPQGRSIALICEGRFLCLDGKLNKGVQKLEEGLQVAKDAGERYEEMLAHAELAKRVEGDGRAAHAAAADGLRDSFRTVG